MICCSKSYLKRKHIYLAQSTSFNRSSKYTMNKIDEKYKYEYTYLITIQRNTKTKKPPQYIKINAEKMRRQLTTTNQPNK